MPLFDESERSLLLIINPIVSFGLIILGSSINRFKQYQLLPGYRRADSATREFYDIKGLADHVGNGLTTLGVLLLIGTVFLYFDFTTWFLIFIGLFIFILLIILLGAPKFMPARQQLLKHSPTDAKHPFLRWLLPQKSFQSLRQKTKLWLQECHTCGQRQDFWDAGGVRGGGFGEPSKLQYCENCKQLRMHRIRKKSDVEGSEI